MPYPAIPKAPSVLSDKRTHIILKKRPRSVTISGFVRDKATTEYLIGASVYDSRTQKARLPITTVSSV